MFTYYLKLFGKIYKKYGFSPVKACRELIFLKKFDFSPAEFDKNMQGKGFEPSDSFETGCLIEPFFLLFDLKSCAVGHAWLPLQ